MKALDQDLRKYFQRINKNQIKNMFTTLLLRVNTVNVVYQNLFNMIKVNDS